MDNKNYIAGLPFIIVGILSFAHGSDESGNRWEENVVLQYLSLDIWPNPNATAWPRDLGASVWCPPDVTIGFTHQGHEVSIDLAQNDMLDVDRIPLVVREGGQIVRAPKMTKHRHPKCFYNEPRSGAAVSFERTKSGTVVSGTYTSEEGLTYVMESVDLLRQHRPGTMVKNKVFPHLPSNYVAVYLLSSNQSSGIEASNDTLRRPKRQTITQHYVEILPVVDYAIYKRWYNFSDETTESDKRDDAREGIRYYFSHVINDMDMRMQAMDSSVVLIRPVLTGFYIAETPEDAPFCEDHVDSNGVLDTGVMYPAYRTWLTNNMNSLPAHDHAMLFSGYDLSAASSGIYLLGQAILGGICSLSYSNSINEDQAQYRSALTATHELGHNLGGDHDGGGTSNTCDPNQQYIMSPSVNPWGTHYLTNSYIFSSCSEQEFVSTINSLNFWNDNCLLNVPTLYNETEYNIFLDELPGQKYSLDEQCSQINGPGAVYCGGDNYRADICNQGMYCTDSDGGNCDDGYSAGNGSPCEDGKWCENEQCVDNDDAPDPLPSCEYGDYGGIIWVNGAYLTCGQWLDSAQGGNPQNCYYDSNYEECCETCENIRSSDPVCPWGAEPSWCPFYILNEASCDTYPQCCTSCAQYTTTSTTTTTTTTTTPAPTTTTTTSTTTTTTPTTTTSTITTTTTPTTTSTTMTTTTAPPTTTSSTTTTPVPTTETTTRQAITTTTVQPTTTTTGTTPKTSPETTIVGTTTSTDQGTTAIEGGHGRQGQQGGQSGSGLDGGILAGIIVLVVAAVTLLAVSACFVLWTKQKKKKKTREFLSKRMEEAKRQSSAAVVVSTTAPTVTATVAGPNLTESEGSEDSDLESESETDIEIEDDVSISSVNMHTTSPLPRSSSIPGSVLA